jgi:riboflavin biosynthesis pyrimidine reductase
LKPLDIARAAAGTRNLEIYGANVARQCLDATLIDEIVVHLAPLLLGDGVRLYGGPGMAQVELERAALAESGQVTGLRFRVAR